MIDAILDSYIEKHVEFLRADWPFFDKLSDPRQDVLANMAFNLGVKGLLGFHDTLSAIEAGQFDVAQAKGEAEIQPHGVADDVAWKAVVLERYRAHKSLSHSDFPRR